MTERFEAPDKVKKFIENDIKLFINNEYIESKKNNKFDVYNPANDTVIVQVAEAETEDVDYAVECAEKAFKGEWSKLTAQERSDLIMKFAELLEQHKEELAYLEALDNGKSYEIALEEDIPSAINQFKYYAGWATKVLGQTTPISPDYFNYSVHEPVGVVGQIIPWNFPLNMASWKMGAALATGCTIVIKPAEQTPLSLLYAGQLIKEAGIPKGVVNIVSGRGFVTGEVISTHPKIRKIAFTGSTETGKGIMKKAADNVKNITLELGGKSANIIFDDADLSEAVKTSVDGVMFNHGQNCSAGTRIYVQSSIYEEFVGEFIEQTKKIKMGAGTEKGIDMGPLISRKQQQRVENYIKIGVEEGGKIAYQQQLEKSDGYFVPPTVFTDLTDDMRIVQEEIFGPVACILPFETEDEVVERANDSEYGLAAAVWTKDIQKAMNVTNQLEAGTVWINDYNLEDPAAAFGGYKQSGIGREMGTYALDNYTEVKFVWMKL
ncbi:aldehyde dehydrogenase family protein [Staphylococcus kloosii]|jgi:aldehyde dehydrogenase (NAD+)|uniref:aldehyde dehydrogenase family protein n=1 Tax=Staphylococcus kloosii TaxID=29384 RepID=UPI00189D7AB8|nr:aldehyde dehydrogenase family protein [Staphylococcus kloosii]MBF7030255.1 aldehyde dehydrogenase family protein [Staphylococcus kloosii]